MVKIYVIDNGGQWTHREWRTLKYLDVETKIIPNTAPFEEVTKDDIDGLRKAGIRTVFDLQAVGANSGFEGLEHFSGIPEQRLSGMYEIFNADSGILALGEIRTKLAQV